jgi:ERF superfamily
MATEQPKATPKGAQTLMAALLAIQARLPELPLGKDREGQVGTQKVKYLSLDKIMDVAMPLLNEQSLVWTTYPTTLDGKPALRYCLEHAVSGESRGDTMLLMLDKDNSQGQGSAITYARRQAISSVLGLTPDDDDDGKAAGGDQRLMVSRQLSGEEIDKMKEAVAKAGLDLADVLATVDAGSVEELSLAQGQQIAGLLKLKRREP